MQKSLLDCFPSCFTPTSPQKELLEKIEKAFSKGKKFVICQAPTGAGKSCLAKSLGNYSHECSDEFKDLVFSYEAWKQDYTGEYINNFECLGERPFGTFVLTVTKQLQDQYLGLFKETGLMKGKTNYVCAVDEDFDVDTAPCVLVPKIKEDCWKVNKCPYYNARNVAVTSQFTTLNYKMFLNLPDHVKRKEYIVCDEASLLEDELIKHFSGNITYSRLKMCGVEYKALHTEDYRTVGIWVANLVENIEFRIEELLKKISKKKETANDKIKLRYLKNLSNSLGLVNSLWSECEYIVDRNKDGVLVEPLRVDKLSKYVFSFADKVLLMSATIIDHKNFAKTLGIVDYEYIESESTFDPKKAPIHVSFDHKINYKTLKSILPKLAKQIKELCEHHKTEKGIIHTHTQEITNYLRDYLGEGGRYLFRDDGVNNEMLLKDHFESEKPTVLVSPSLTHGVDLKDELARFAIVCKAPYLPLSSKRIKRRFEEDEDWYRDKCLQNLVQIAGRGVRSKEDWCVTYILDATASNLILRSKDVLPKEFLARFQ